MDHPQDKRHWTREPMVWMVIAIPLTSVVLGIAMITLAVTHNDGLVVDDYYKRGLEINEVLEREARASELRLVADIEFEPSNNRVSVLLSGGESFRGPDEIELGFYHATRRDRDQVLSLRRNSQGIYSAPMPNLSEGRWYVSAETAEWRLNRAVFFPEEGGFRIEYDPEKAGSRS